MIRGLTDKGTPLGGSTRSSRLLQESHDSSESDEGESSGGWVTINLRLPEAIKSVKRKFRTSQKVKVIKLLYYTFTVSCLIYLDR